MKDYTKPPKWLPGLALALFVLGTLWWIATPNAPHRTTPVAEFAYAERIDFTDALNKVRNDPGSIEKLVFVKGMRVFPDKVIVDLKGRSSAVVADIPGEFDYNIIAGEADKQNVRKESLPMSGKDARQEYVQGPAEGGEDMFTKIMGWVINIVLFGLPLVVFFMLFRAMKNMGPGGAAGGFAKSKHKKFEPDKGPKVMFADVAGVPEAVAEAQEVVEYLKDPKELVDNGGEPLRGILLVGPPGTGKTLLARATAGEAGVPFFSISGSDFVEMFVGVGAARVRDMFEQVRKEAPAILFIDEIDAVGQQRGAGIGGGNDERYQTLNQILVEMDGFEKGSGIVVMAATNRPDVLDPALMRPGRFTKQITVGMPDIEGRRQILTVHSKNKKFAEGADVEYAARNTAGFSGADLAEVMNDAVRLSLRRWKKARKNGSKEITTEDLDKAITRVQFKGPSDETASRRLNPIVKEVIAVHEGGHGTVTEYWFRKGLDLVKGMAKNQNQLVDMSWACRFGDPVQRITIIGVAGTGGHMISLPEDEIRLQTREMLIGRIATAYGATLSERIFTGTSTTGCSNDLKQAYQIAKALVTQLGQSGLGPISIGEDQSNPFLGRALAGGMGGYGLGPLSSDQIDHEIGKIMLQGARLAVEALLARRTFLKALVPELIERETLISQSWKDLWDMYPDDEFDPKQIDVIVENAWPQLMEYTCKDFRARRLELQASSCKDC